MRKGNIVYWIFSCFLVKTVCDNEKRGREESIGARIQLYFELSNRPKFTSMQHVTFCIFILLVPQYSISYVLQLTRSKASEPMCSGWNSDLNFTYYSTIFRLFKFCSFLELYSYSLCGRNQQITFYCTQDGYFRGDINGYRLYSSNKISAFHDFKRFYRD